MAFRLFGTLFSCLYALEVYDIEIVGDKPVDAGDKVLQDGDNKPHAGDKKPID